MITIRKTQHSDGTRAAYDGETLFATINGERPSRANGRLAQWCVCYIGGRVEWFDTYAEARDYVLKGKA